MTTLNSSCWNQTLFLFFLLPAVGTHPTGKLVQILPEAFGTLPLSGVRASCTTRTDFTSECNNNSQPAVSGNHFLQRNSNHLCNHCLWCSIYSISSFWSLTLELWTWTHLRCLLCYHCRAVLLWTPSSKWCSQPLLLEDHLFFMAAELWLARTNGFSSSCLLQMWKALGTVLPLEP